MSFILTVAYAECHIKAPYAECRYAECRYAECRGASYYGLSGWYLRTRKLNSLQDY